MYALFACILKKWFYTYVCRSVCCAQRFPVHDKNELKERREQWKVLRICLGGHSKHLTGAAIRTSTTNFRSFSGPELCPSFEQLRRTAE